MPSQKSAARAKIKFFSLRIKDTAGYRIFIIDGDEEIIGIVDPFFDRDNGHSIFELCKFHGIQ